MPWSDEAFSLKGIKCAIDIISESRPRNTSIKTLEDIIYLNELQENLSMAF
jgi:hypothetical protein